MTHTLQKLLYISLFLIGHTQSAQDPDEYNSEDDQKAICLEDIKPTPGGDHVPSKENDKKGGYLDKVSKPQPQRNQRRNNIVELRDLPQKGITLSQEEHDKIMATMTQTNDDLNFLLQSQSTLIEEQREFNEKYYGEMDGHLDSMGKKINKAIEFNAEVIDESTKNIQEVDTKTADIDQQMRDLGIPIPPNSSQAGDLPTDEPTLASASTGNTPPPATTQNTTHPQDDTPQEETTNPSVLAGSSSSSSDASDQSSKVAIAVTGGVSIFAAFVAWGKGLFKKSPKSGDSPK